MRVECFIPSQDLESLNCYLRQDLSGAFEGISKPPFSEVCHGNVLIAGEKYGGSCLFYERIPIINLLSDMTQSVSRNKKVDKAEENFCDTEQLYSIRLQKRNDVLVIDDYLKFDYVKFQNRLRFDARRFFEELLYFCPDFRKSRDFDVCRGTFKFDF